MDADTCANLITRCVEWFWAIIGVSCACLQQTKHCDSQQVFVNKHYGRSQSAATTYASKLLIQAFCIPVIWFRVRRCCRRAPIVHTTCASAHPLCWRVCVLQSDSPKNANNACANIVFFVVLCMVNGAVARSPAKLQSLNWSFKLIIFCYDVFVSVGWLLEGHKQTFVGAVQAFLRILHSCLDNGIMAQQPPEFPCSLAMWSWHHMCNFFLALNAHGS